MIGTIGSPQRARRAQRDFVLNPDPGLVEGGWGYYPGKLAVDGAKECIMLTVSGPAVQNWSAEIPYERVDNRIEFGAVCEEIGGEVGFLEGWASEQHKVQ